MMSINRDVNGLLSELICWLLTSPLAFTFQAAASAFMTGGKGKGKLIETSLLEAAMVFQEAAIIVYLPDMQTGTYWYASCSL